MDEQKACKATPAKDLRDRIMNSNIPKSEAEHWAKGEIEALTAENAGLKEYSDSRDESIKVYREEIKELKYTVEKYLRQIKLGDELIEKQKKEFLEHYGDFLKYGDF